MPITPYQIAIAELNAIAQEKGYTPFQSCLERGLYSIWVDASGRPSPTVGIFLSATSPRRVEGKGTHQFWVMERSGNLNVRSALEMAQYLNEKALGGARLARREIPATCGGLSIE